MADEEMHATEQAQIVRGRQESVTPRVLAVGGAVPEETLSGRSGVPPMGNPAKIAFWDRPPPPWGKTCGRR